MDKAQYRKLMDWMKNDRHLQDWWEGEFVKSDAEIDVALRNKMFVRIKGRDGWQVTVCAGCPYEYSEMGCHDLSARLPRFLHLLPDRHVSSTRNASRCESW